MALKHQRAFQWRGEDLGSGTGNVKQRILTAEVSASGAPLTVSPSFLGSTSYISGLLGVSYVPTLTGLNRFLTNQSAVYFITMTARLDSAAGTLIQFPIPPLQSVFFPANLTGVQAVLNADSPFTLTLPPGASGSTMPVAGSANALSYDLIVEM